MSEIYVYIGMIVTMKVCIYKTNMSLGLTFNILLASQSPSVNGHEDYNKEHLKGRTKCNTFTEDEDGHSRSIFLIK